MPTGGPVAGKGPSKKKREAEKRAKRQREARRKTSTPKATVRGAILDNECRMDLMICHPSDDKLNQQITAIIDTGCTGTAIRSDIVSALNLPLIGQADVHAFGGVKRSPVVLLKQVVVTVEGTVSRLTQAIVGDEAEMRDEMLFGMDSMVGSVLTVDGIRNRWEWKLK